MSNTKTTKRALFSSIMAMLLCVVMLIGTTFAWFTDSASTAVNKIQSGTLDVQLLDAETLQSVEGETLKWKTADNRDQSEILWEPGCTYELQPVIIKNAGNLALKYKIVITGIQGDAELNEAIEWTINDTALDSDHPLAAGASDTLTIKGHMKKEAGNEYQGKSIDGIGITVYATQDTVEYDSIDNQYDLLAKYANLKDATDETTKTVTVFDVQILRELSMAVSSGVTFADYTVTLDANLDLSDELWKPIGEKAGQQFAGTFDGQGHSVKINITPDSLAGNEAEYDGYAAFFGAISNTAVIKNLTVSGTVTGKNVAGIVARANGGTIENCTNNATVNGTAKAGGIMCLNSGSTVLRNCTNNGDISVSTSGVVIGGGIAAYCNKGAEIDNCVNTGKIDVSAGNYAGGIVGYYSAPDGDVINGCKNSGEIISTVSTGGIIGIATKAITVQNCENTGKVNGLNSSCAGGIVGSANGIVKDCSNTASVNGRYAGGVVGSAGTLTIENCSGGSEAITAPAFTLGFTGQSFTLVIEENKTAGRILGANQGSGSSNVTVLKLADNNGDSYEGIGTVGICGNTTTWANLEIASGTFYGEPLAGNTAYIKLDSDAVWGEKAAGDYVCGGLTPASRLEVWTLR